MAWLWPLAPWSGVAAIYLVIRYLVRRDDRKPSRVEALARDAPASAPPMTGMPPTASESAARPVPAQTLIVPPCGCINTFTRTEIIPCAYHAARAAERDTWAAEWNERLHRP